MKFTIFRNFLEFFWIYLDLFLIFKCLNKLKKFKKGVYIARVHVDATWHSGPRGFATWTARGRLRGADVTCVRYLYLG